MTDEELAEIYVSRLKKCLAAIKILVIVTMAAVAALIIFVAVAKGVKLQESSPNGLLAGIIIPGCIAAASVIGALATLVLAKVTLGKLKKLDVKNQ